MWVIDTFGRTEYCDVILKLQDNNSNDACANDPNATANIIGQIFTEAEQGLSEVEVGLEDITMGMNLKAITTELGDFQFESVEYFHNYHLEPYKNDDTNNGVTTLDLVYIQQYLMGLREIDSPYKLIAADINGDMRVSGLDLLELRKLILGYTETFETNTSWRFIPSEFQFSNPAFPWDYNQELEINELIENIDKGDFIAVKIGDINGNATINLREEKIQSRNQTSMTLEVENKIIDGKNNMVFSAATPELILGMQFTLDFHQAINFEQIVAGHISVTSDNIFVIESEGKISLSWGHISSQDIDELELFTLTTSGKIDLSELEINSSITQSEAYGEDGQVLNLVLEKKINLSSPDAFTLYQNSPNPFKEQTKILFSLPESGNVNISIFDINGKTLYSSDKIYQKGMNEVDINRDNIPGKGILFYTVSFGDQSVAKKMIITD
jgi:hypothetical protein